VAVPARRVQVEGSHRTFFDTNLEPSPCLIIACSWVVTTVQRVTEIAVRVLGGVSARVDGGQVPLTPANQRLLSVLVAAGPGGIGTLACAEEYGATGRKSTADDDALGKALRMAVSRLRGQVPAVRVSAGRYYLDLPAASVDLWHLLFEDRPTVDPKLAGYLLAGEPFAGMQATALITSAVQDARSARLAILEQLVAMTPLPENLLRTIFHLVERDLLARPTAVATAVDLHTQSRRDPEALNLIEQCEVSLLRSGETQLPDALAHRRQRILAAAAEKRAYSRPSPNTAQRKVAESSHCPARRAGVHLSAQ